MNAYFPLRIPARCAPRAGGFTLVELLVVLLIAGVMSFYAMAQFGNMGEVNAQGFADQLASSLRFAQKAAVAQRRLIFVNVVAGSNRLYACLDSATSCAHPLRQPSGGALDITGPATVALTSSVSQFSFNGLGSPSTAGAIHIVATAASGQQYNITVQADTGYVQRS